MSYACSECSYTSTKWMGFCPRCKTDGALVQTAAPSSRRRARLPDTTSVVKALEGEAPRFATGIGEVDRVLGGGLVPGAAILVGGEPGVGKSTLLLQVAGRLAASGAEVLVASAEESVRQVGLRASRIGVDDPGVMLLAERDVDVIVEVARERSPALLVVDSIQTVAADEVGGAPGGVAQVRECAARLVHTAKESGIPVVLVGHVTKEGGIAGPKLLEHVVDVVLYLEGDPQNGLRLLRSLKNRFGATHQVGVFEMASTGLEEVADPSARLVGDRRTGAPGTVLFPTMDGRRPLMVEIQALVAPTSNPQPRRSVKGLDAARVHQVLAVLDRHGGLSCAAHDVYVNVIGGLRIREPAVDLPVAVAIASSLLEQPLDNAAVWGEVGLTGEVRSVADAERRREEAERLGARRVVVPQAGGTLAGALADLGLRPARPRGV